MATGLIGIPDITDGNLIKFDNGIIVELGNTPVSATTYSSSAPMPYRGDTDVAVDSQFTTIITALARPSEDDATWGNSSVSSVNSQNKTFHVTQGQNSSGTRSVNWIAIGLWK